MCYGAIRRRSLGKGRGERPWQRVQGWIRKRNEQVKQKARCQPGSPAAGSRVAGQVLLCSGKRRGVYLDVYGDGAEVGGASHERRGTLSRAPEIYRFWTDQQKAFGERTLARPAPPFCCLQTLQSALRLRLRRAVSSAGVRTAPYGRCFPFPLPPGCMGGKMGRVAGSSEWVRGLRLERV